MRAMNARVRLLLGFALALAVLDAAAPRAQACGGSSCLPERFLPFSGSLPANAPGIFWAPGHGDLGATPLDRIQMRCTGAGGAERAIELEAEPLGASGVQLLKVATPLVAGEQCTIDGGNECGYTDPHISGRSMLTIGDEAPLPESLGTLVATPAKVDWVEASANAACSLRQAACVIELSLELSDEAAPWRDGLELTTHIDGGEWWVQRVSNEPNITGGSSVGRGRDVIFAWVDGAANETDTAGLPQGAYSVQMRATLPGTDIAIATQELTVDLHCEGGDVPLGVRDGGAGDGDGDGDGDTDAAVEERGTMPIPRGPVMRDEVDLNDEGCSATARAQTSTLGWLALACSALLRRRRSHRA
jgi:uncharacterized protein (TIGR03382 family)